MGDREKGVRTSWQLDSSTPASRRIRLTPRCCLGCCACSCSVSTIVFFILFVYYAVQYASDSTYMGTDRSRLKKICTAQCPLGMTVLTNTAVPGSCVCYPADNVADETIPDRMHNMVILGIGTNEDCPSSAHGHADDSATSDPCSSQCYTDMLVVTNTRMSGSCACYPRENTQSRLVPFYKTNMEPLGIGTKHRPFCP